MSEQCPQCGHDMSRDLTEREREVLQELTEHPHETMEQIASRLFISKSTIKTHVRQIYGKLGTKNRLASILVGLRQGIISLADDFQKEAKG